MATTIDTNHDQVVFENIPDQYVKGEDVTVYFTILNDIKDRQNEFQIGLLRVNYHSNILLNKKFQFRLVQ